jgi:hypothetical protein
MVKYNPSRPNVEDVSIVGAIKPPYPMFGVYHDESLPAKVYTRPVLFFVLREFVVKSGSECTSDAKLFPVCFSDNPTNLIEETSAPNRDTGFLGLSEKPEVKKDDWLLPIRELKKFSKD